MYDDIQDSVKSHYKTETKIFFNLKDFVNEYSKIDQLR